MGAHCMIEEHHLAFKLSKYKPIFGLTLHVRCSFSFFSSLRLEFVSHFFEFDFLKVFICKNLHGAQNIMSTKRARLKK